MTNEEVIRQLNDLKGIGSDYVPINEALDMAIKALEAWEKVEKDIHTAIDNALMYGYGDNYINACETILQIIQKQEKCLKMDKAESEVSE